MKVTKKFLFATALSFVLTFDMSSTAAFAQEQTQSDITQEPPVIIQEQTQPVCAHGNIGAANGTTMYYMNRITYGYDQWGNKVEKVWYKCSVCGYETYVAFIIE